MLVTTWASTSFISLDAFSLFVPRRHAKAYHYMTLTTTYIEHSIEPMFVLPNCKRKLIGSISCCVSIEFYSKRIYEKMFTGRYCISTLRLSKDLVAIKCRWTYNEVLFNKFSNHRRHSSSCTHSLHHQDCGFVISEHDGTQKLVFASSDPANIDSTRDHGLLPMTHVSKSQDTLSQTIPKQSLSLWGAWIFPFLCLMSPLRNTYHLRTRFNVKCRFLLRPTSALHQHFESSLILNHLLSDPRATEIMVLFGFLCASIRFSSFHALEAYHIDKHSVHLLYFQDSTFQVFNAICGPHHSCLRRR